MSSHTLIKVTEPRLDTVKHKGFHGFRVIWLGSYAIWLIFFSTQNSELTRALVTTGLLLGIWAGWHFAKRWSEAALVLELTPSHFSFSFRANQRLKTIPLDNINLVKHHRHLLIFEGEDVSVQAYFPVKHRHYIAKILESLQKTHPQIQQIPV
jgi:hypothetical protein